MTKEFVWSSSRTRTLWFSSDGSPLYILTGVSQNLSFSPSPVVSIPPFFCVPLVPSLLSPGLRFCVSTGRRSEGREERRRGGGWQMKGDLFLSQLDRKREEEREG